MSTIGLRRLASFKAGVSGTAVRIEWADGTAAISQAALTTLNTAEKLLAEIEKQAKRQLPKVFVHINRDGSVAVAVGGEPHAWPEDGVKQ